MTMWNIVLIVLVIINVVAFAHSVWATYHDWKKNGRANWSFPLLGFFFIPVCILIVIGWPISKLLSKIFENAKERNRKKMFEESKKYQFRNFGFRLKDLPFEPTSGEIIYIENNYNEKINSLIRNNLHYIQKCLDKSRYFKSKFIYVPTLIEDIKHEEKAIGYFAPYRVDLLPTSKILINSSSLLDFMLVPGNRKNITPCFARYIGKDSEGSVFECVGFELDDDIDEREFFKLLCSAFDHFPRPVGPAFQTAKPKREGKPNADETFDKASKQLIKEVEERISQLRKMGVGQWVLEQLVKPELKLSKLVVTKDYRLLLPDYNSIEIKMEPLVKAVFLLFVKHPEGILFKHLPDYREELTQIYVKLKPYGLNNRVVQSIEDVTNPLLNSINEKCARIRGAFVGQFDDRMAKYYYIDGKRGEAKKISLPRDLVVWE